MTNAPSDGSYEIDCHAVALDLREAMNSEHIPNGQVSDELRTERGPEWCAIFDTLRDYRLSNMTFEGTDEPFCLVDLVSTIGGDISTGEDELIALADDVSLALDALTRRSSAGVNGDAVAAMESARTLLFGLGLWSSDEYAALTAALSSPSHIGEDEPVAWTVRDGEPSDELGATFDVLLPSGEWRGCVAVDANDARNTIRAEWDEEQERLASYRPSPSVPPQGETAVGKFIHRKSAIDALNDQFDAEEALTPSPTLEPTDAEVERAIIAYWGADIQAHYVAMGMDGHKAMRAALIASRQSTSGEGV